MQGIFLGAGVSEGYMFQGQFTGFAGGGQGKAVLKGKGFFTVQEFPKEGQGKAFAVEQGQLGQDLCHLPGKAAQGSEIEYKPGAIQA